MIYNKIPAVFSGTSRIAIAEPVNYQYDVAQILVISGLELPEYYEVDFCNVGDTQTITMVATADGVAIPDNLLLTGKRIKAYIVVQGEDEGAVETRYEVTIPVNKRPERSDIEPTPSEQSTIDSLIAALNDGVGRSEDAADDAEGSANEASDYASAALASKQAAKASEYAAKASEENANASATAAANSATDSAQSATASANSASAAAQSAVDANIDADRAEQAAVSAGYMFFYIDERGHLIYQRTSTVQVDFYLHDGHLYVKSSRIPLFCLKS